jgi:hypothetical protein
MKDLFTTLDGEFWNRQELINKAHEDKFYYGYLAKACLSSSSVTKLLKSPREYLMSFDLPTESTALSEGYLFHASILEKDKFDECLFLNVATKNNKEYKLAKKERWDVFTMKERDNALRLRDRFYNCSEASDFILNADFEVPEINYVNNYPFRGKADILGDCLVDLKSTANIHKFKNSAYIYNYDSQAYIYCNLFGKTYKDYRFVVVDKSPTNELGIFNISEDFYYRGEQKVEKAIQVYETFVKNEFDLNDYLIEDTL